MLRYDVSVIFVYFRDVRGTPEFIACLCSMDYGEAIQCGITSRDINIVRCISQLHEKVSSCIVLVLRSYLRRSSLCERHLQKASSHYISWRFCAHYTMTGAILGTLTRLTLFATGIASCFASSGKRWLQVFFIIVRKLSYALYFCLGFICSQWMKSRFYADESHTYHMIIHQTGW